MKIKSNVTEIAHDDLVNLFSGSMYCGYSFFGCIYNSKDSKNVKKSGDCIEDIIAKILLSGKSVEIVDTNAEDSDDFYGNLPHRWDADEQMMVYTVTLDDIKKGIEKCLECSSTDDNSSCSSWLAKCARDIFMDGGYNLDKPEAEAVMQVIVFGELIYG